MSDPPDRQVSLAAVLAILDKYAAAPDGYYFAQKSERIVGWHTAVSRIRADVEALADDR